MKISRFTAISALVIAVLSATVIANEQFPILAAASQSKISQDDAAMIAAKHTGGQVLSVDSREKNNSIIHYVKILLQNGNVRNIPVDANSGKILKE